MNTLDLDILEPKGGEVTLGGKTYPVSAPKMKTVIGMSKVYTKLQQLVSAEPIDEQAIIVCLEEFQTSLYPVIPDLEKDTVSLSLQQATALAEFVLGFSMPEDMQKKTTTPDKQPDSLDTSAIS